MRPCSVKYAKAQVPRYFVSGERFFHASIHAAILLITDSLATPSTDQKREREKETLTTFITTQSRNGPFKTVLTHLHLLPK